jgi:hypothetical protein
LHETEQHELEAEEERITEQDQGRRAGTPNWVTEAGEDDCPRGRGNEQRSNNQLLQTGQHGGHAISATACLTLAVDCGSKLSTRMSATVEAILANLKVVDDERACRSSKPGLAAKVAALKEFQQRRFSHTYADLLLTARYGAAARFFLNELYGPADFSRRDTQFARVVPALVRLFPRAVVETVATLAQLHALSEVLDTAMARCINGSPITASGYIRAWQITGRPQDRESQIALTLEVASRLDRFSVKPMLRNSLRLMRGPAQAAGLADLQRFLECGFDTFRAMKGAKEFVDIVGTRERALASSLFQTDLADSASPRATEHVYARLPAKVFRSLE